MGVTAAAAAARVETERRAVLLVCHRAHDVEDARLLLDILGLVPDEHVQPPIGPAPPPPPPPPPPAPAPVDDVPDLDATASRHIEAADTDLPDLDAVAEADETPPTHSPRRSNPRPCVGCGRLTVAQPQWRQMSAAEKDGRTLRAARDRCWTCYDQLTRRTAKPKPEPESPTPVPEPEPEPQQPETRPAEDTSDDVTEALVTTVLSLITAVHRSDSQAIAGAFNVAAALHGGDALAAARHLAVVCAGMCSDTAQAYAALAWTLDHHEHRSRTDALRAGANSR